MKISWNEYYLQEEPHPLIQYDEDKNNGNEKHWNHLSPEGKRETKIKFPEHSINEKPRNQPYKTLLLATVVKELLLYNQ